MRAEFKKNKRISQLRALTAKEWQLLMVSMVLLPMIAIALGLFGIKRTKSIMAAFIIKRDDDDPLDKQIARADQVARMVSIVANHGPYYATCLKKSLLIWWLLERQGIHATLEIGVKKEKDDLLAHAWVEYMGKALLGSGKDQTKFEGLNSLG